MSNKSPWNFFSSKFKDVIKNIEENIDNALGIEEKEKKERASKMEENPKIESELPKPINLNFDSVGKKKVEKKIEKLEEKQNDKKEDNLFLLLNSNDFDEKISQQKSNKSNVSPTIMKVNN